MSARLCGLTAVILLQTGALTAAPNEQEEIQEFYRRGLAGDKEAVEQCIVKLEAVLTSRPGNQLARVYLGSAYTLRSRDLGFGPKKLQALKRGLAVMDEAVAAAPDDPKVRLARALTTAALPGFFGRSAQSRKDFALLAGTADQSPQQFDDGELQIVYYNAGLAAKASREHARARTLWEKALRYPIDRTIVEKTQIEMR